MSNAIKNNDLVIEDALRQYLNSKMDKLVEEAIHKAIRDLRGKLIEEAKHCHFRVVQNFREGNTQLVFSINLEINNPKE